MEYIRFSKLLNGTQYGYTADGTSDTEGNRKYLRITDIVPYFVDKSSVPFCKIDERKVNKYLLRENDLLIARTGATTGYNFLVTKEFEDSIFASYLVRYDYDKKKIYPYYLKYVLKSKQWYGFVNNYIGGSAQPGMNPTTFGKFLVPLFDYKTQEKIAHILHKYDELIENNDQRIKLLEKTAELLYKEWFVRFRFPGHKSSKVKLQSAKGWVYGDGENGQQVPEDWKFDELINIAEFKRGKNITSAEMVEGIVPVIAAGLEPSGYHNKANVRGCNLTVSASGANAGYLAYHLEDIWAADCSYYQDDKKIWFVYNALKFLQPVISNMQVESAQPHVYAKNLNRISTIIPNQEIIEKFVEKVEPIYEEIKYLKQKNDNLVSQRDSLLPRLMSSKINLEGKEVV